MIGKVTDVRHKTYKGKALLETMKKQAPAPAPAKEQRGKDLQQQRTKPDKQDETGAEVLGPQSRP